MHYKPLLSILIMLVLATMACGITIDIPVDRIEVGPTQRKDIFVEQPDALEAEVILEFGAGELDLSPGAEDALIIGEATYNLDELEPVVEVDGERVRISTGDRDFSGIPKIGENLENRWNLELGELPIKLEIQAGGYQGDFELGGLALESLDVSDGAADVQLKFSKPNPVEMDSFKYTTGASNLRLTGLANANFSSMVFRSGAGDYRLDFSGDLRRDAVVNIESGLSRIVIRVPRDTNAVIYYQGGLASVLNRGAWQQSGSEYTVDGIGPKLIINIDLGAGSLELETE